jgi:hypothetical protein
VRPSRNLQGVRPRAQVVDRRALGIVVSQIHLGHPLPHRHLLGVHLDPAVGADLEPAIVGLGRVGVTVVVADGDAVVPSSGDLERVTEKAVLTSLVRWEVVGSSPSEVAAVGRDQTV